MATDRVQALREALELISASPDLESAKDALWAFIAQESLDPQEQERLRNEGEGRFIAHLFRSFQQATQSNQGFEFTFIPGDTTLDFNPTSLTDSEARHPDWPGWVLKIMPRDA